LPIFLIFFIGAIAETNRAPFDLAEAESELVSGFMTEHAAVIFVFFFLAEYGSILLMCILTSIFFFGGYLYSLPNIIDLFEKVISIYFLFEYNIINIIDNPFNEGLLYGLNLGIKSSILVFIFI
jgi:NADH-ubiquinone oxidoreductase chain 1